MIQNLTFRRYDRSHVDSELQYTTTQLNGDDYSLNQISMKNLGHNTHIQIQNFTSEPIIVAGSLRCTPTVIAPIDYEGSRMSGSQDYVVVTIHHAEIGAGIKIKQSHKNTAQKTVIRVTGRKLRSGAVFIDEIDSYMTTVHSSHVASRFISEDALTTDWDKLDIVVNLANQDTAKIYDRFQELAQNCVARQDLIQVRVGNLKRAQGMRIAILDTYFVPSVYNNLVTDETLGDDVFIIEFLRQSTQREFQSTFTELKAAGSIYIDQNEVETISGLFCNMVLFPDADHLARYFHKRKSIERFREETIYLAQHSGDIRLRTDIEQLKSKSTETGRILSEKEELIKRLTETIVDLKDSKRHLEGQMKNIREHWSAEHSSEVVLGGIENERLELQYKEKLAKAAHETAVVKGQMEKVKAIGAIITVTLTVALTAYGAWRKLKA